MTQPARQAFVGVGANLGDRWATMRRASGLLATTPGIVTLEESPVYETAPVGGIRQPPFLNRVLGIETQLSPEDLLARLLEIERTQGRDRTREIRWGPRSLDLDLLLYEGEHRTSEPLLLPHPRMFERAFVCIPLIALLRASHRFTPSRWPRLLESLAPSGQDPGVRPWTVPANETA